MSDRALLIGINAYPAYPLYQCVHDVERVAHLLYRKFGFSRWDIRMLCDARATRNGIMDGLGWLVRDAQPGDRLLFHYSGHGAQMAALDDAGEVDGLDEVICPVDFDWGDNVIRDNDIRHVFSAVPAGVNCTLVFDSCHSGDIDRAPYSSARKERRWFAPPVDIEWALRGARDRFSLRKIRDIGNDLNVAVISACADDETAAETSEGGALTTALCAELTKHHDHSLKQIISTIERRVTGQTVQGVGPKQILDAPFMARP